MFSRIDPIPLTSAQIQWLLDAARQNWRFVEPAIFGTLLERALDPRERHKLGAHYTPRAYVERLVMPTVMEPLRRDWSSVQVAAAAWVQQRKPDQALQELRAFHHRHFFFLYSAARRIVFPELLAKVQSWRNLCH